MKKRGQTKEKRKEIKNNPKEKRILKKRTFKLSTIEVGGKASPTNSNTWKNCKAGVSETYVPSV